MDIARVEMQEEPGGNVGKWAHPPVSSMTGNLGGHRLPGRAVVSMPQLSARFCFTNSNCMMVIYLKSPSSFQKSSIEPGPILRAEARKGQQIVVLGERYPGMGEILVRCCHHSIPWPSAASLVR
jgi:hypothetical protein